MRSIITTWASIRISGDFYAKERAGNMPTTAGLNCQNYTEIYEPTLAAGKDILMISFSSALSGTHQMLEQARQELLKKYPERSFDVVNTPEHFHGSGAYCVLCRKDVEGGCHPAGDNQMGGGQPYAGEPLVFRGRPVSPEAGRKTSGRRRLWARCWSLSPYLP